MGRKADYQISFSLNEGIPEIIITGNAVCSNLVNMLNEVDIVLKTNKANKAILDIRSLNERIEYTEIYRFVRNQHFFIYEIEAAVVDLPENAHFGTAVKYAGLHWKWFTDINEARTWLIKSFYQESAILYLRD
ncbi:MAG: hypothetical protein JW976_12665 [Syntrophaceae bacterium]|nr:hypothetical protein [Syntrophaceae bacterium]